MKLLLAAVVVASGWAQTPDIEQIMSRVAINQAKSMDQRKEWVYHQKQLLRMMRGSHKVAREEHREYTIIPRERGVKKELVKFDGKYELHGKYVPYEKPGYQYKGMDIDGDLIDSLSRDLTDHRSSRDGFSHELFPFTYHQQLKYRFRLVKAETYHGRPVYRVRFEPKPHQDFGDAVWKGEALIDAEEYQPISVATDMAMKIPTAVKVLLGTNIKGLGFSVTYRKFADGVWFPVTYGGEFEVRALFLYKRIISVSLVNDDFRHADVNSNIAYADEEEK